MKKIICMLAALTLLFACCAAEEAASATPGIVLITPTPTAAPAGQEFSSEDIIVTLPAGLELLEDSEFAAYEAATEDDFPGAARTLLAAANGDASSVLVFSVVESELTAAEFAADAARIVLGGTDAVNEVQFGENRFSAFSCAIGEQQYRLYMLQGESSILLAGFSGLDEAEIEAMLSGLIF